MIICHRGFWNNISDQNTESSFYKAFKKKFGIETDIRDCNGKVVISHDMPTGKEIELTNLLKLHIFNNTKVNLLLNIKSDGLHSKLLEIMNEFPRIEFYCFDMSVPDMKIYADLKIPFLTRLSDYEKDLCFISEAKGIWLDAFNNDWYSKRTINKFLKMDKLVYIVSSECHNRPYKKCWQRLKKMDLPWSSKKIFLCTDFPEEAHNFFSIKDEKIKDYT